MSQDWRFIGEFRAHMGSIRNNVKRLHNMTATLKDEDEAQAIRSHLILVLRQLEPIQKWLEAMED